MCRVRVQLDRRQVVFLRFLLEGYDGLATIVTVDRWASIVELHVPESRVEELTDLLDAVEAPLGILSIEQGAL